MELCLKLVAIIGSHFFDAEGKLFDDIVDEGDGVGLVVTLVDSKGSYARRIINIVVLIVLDGFVVFVLECQKLNIKLNLMARNLLWLSDGVDLTKPGAAR